MAVKICFTHQMPNVQTGQRERRVRLRTVSTTGADAPNLWLWQQGRCNTWGGAADPISNIDG